jgi:flagellar basal body P-ring protein FlgI
VRRNARKEQQMRHWKSDAAGMPAGGWRVRESSLMRGAALLLGIVGLIGLTGLTGLIGLAGCESGSKKNKQTIPVQLELAEVPASLRGLIGTEVQFRNVTPTLISGYGLVVGLRGTGGLPINDAIAASMQRQLGLLGIGRANEQLRGTPLENKTAGEILRDPNVAIVEVLAAVEPGVPEGTNFDLLVRAINATSLEGGVLWSTDLRLGSPTVFGQGQTRKIGVGRGAVYLNPFAIGNADTSGFNMTVGRVLGGGTVTDSFNIVLTLNSESHGRARSIVSAINSRFPSGAGDGGKTARGDSGTNIVLTVPSRYRLDTVAFLNLVRNLQIDQSTQQGYARRYVEAIKAEPEYAERLSWALEAQGEQVLPIIRELYDSPDLVPRMAGLKAGARLSDPRAAPALREIIKTGQGTVRTTAIRLLAEVDAGPSVDLALRELLQEEDLLVRITAYEALAQRAERSRFVYLTRVQSRNRELRSQAMSPSQLEEIARVSLPTGTIQGVSRTPIEGKFLLDRVSGGQPMVYVTQQGVPRVVIFGDEDNLRPGSVLAMWDGRLLLSAEADAGRQGTLRARYTPVGRRTTLTQEVPATLASMVTLLARKPSDVDNRPGFNLSYSEVVAVLSAMQENGATPAIFATEQDRLNNQLLAAQSARDMLDRPESPEDKDAVIVRRGNVVAPAAQPTKEAKPVIVPIEK